MAVNPTSRYLEEVCDFVNIQKHRLSVILRSAIGFCSTLHHKSPTSGSVVGWLYPTSQLSRKEFINDVHDLLLNTVIADGLAIVEFPQQLDTYVVADLIRILPYF